ncbi:hypothetical protein [Ilumatobacter coccineus]|uniref:Lipoprotein n=1 Tax=Ilumatobacter coccineus (strain NBRC 103263 / KCTC 29153 / YM16-304) TaxID=1313172 RepID=A0A6C7E8J4_ILUCY|nr:hypothetical protein [Ilumatobacter coccineus]BAN01519.1 hypothetical protein YM304_12050 [Ilumatobacter coccineus YM16-304]
MQPTPPARARRRSAIACALTIAALAGCSGGSDASDTTVATTEPPAVEAVGPNGTTDVTMVVTLNESPFFITEDTRVGSLCGGDQGAGTAVESSRVDLFREEQELIESLTGPGVVDEIVLDDEGRVAAITCSFGVELNLEGTDAEPYDLIFTSGRTADAVSITLPGITTDELTGDLELAN